MEQMPAIPINDFMAHDAKLRIDGTVVREMFPRQATGAIAQRIGPAGGGPDHSRGRGVPSAAGRRLSAGEGLTRRTTGSGGRPSIERATPRDSVPGQQIQIVLYNLRLYICSDSHKDRRKLSGLR
jgi:hypothetical protein